MLAALLIVPILTFLIFVHELGHYTMARRAGVKVEEFGFGLPPRLWGIQRGDTMWSINWIPLGGFVRVLGEDGKDFSDRSMQTKTAGQRALFLGAGSIMNFLTAFVLIGVLLFAQGEQVTNLYITEVAPDSPALEAGFIAGDRVVNVDGQSVDTASGFQDVTQDNLGDPMAVTVIRGGEETTLNVQPRLDPPPGQGAVGVRIADVTRSQLVVEDVPDGSIASELGLQEGDRILSVAGTQVIDRAAYLYTVRNHAGETIDAIVRRDGETVTVPLDVPAGLEDGEESFGAEIVANVQFDRPPLINIVPMTFVQFFDFIRAMFDGLVMILNGEVPLSDIAGPIGMGQLTSEIVEQSSVPAWVAIITIMIVLSLNLGLLNLLPLPALDGGRLLFVGIEVLRRGKRVAPEKEGLVHMVGLVVLLMFMVAVAFVDIDRIISGQSLLQ
ncbi:MAG: RIP metalloprotease RseP [Thermomicrobiales bacterium]